MEIFLLYIFLGLIITLLIYLVFKKIIEETLKRDVRKFLSEDDFLRISKMKYTKNYDIILYRVLSAGVFTAILSYIVASYSGFNLIHLLIIGTVFFAVSILLDILFQFLTLRRVVQGLYDSVWINKIGAPAFVFYVLSSIVYAIVIICIWLLFFHTYFSSVFLFLITISIFSTIYLTLSGHSRIISYTILILVTVAIQKSVIETIGYWESSRPFDMVFSIAFVGIAVLIMALVYKYFKESKNVETERYEHLYEPYFVVFLISWIVFIEELLANRITHTGFQITFGEISTPVLMALLFYGFYPITRFYSTVEKSIKDLKKLMSPKMILASSIIPSFISYMIFLLIVFISSIFGATSLKWVVNAIFTVLSIAFLYEFTILFEVMDDSIETLFRESKNIETLMTEKTRKRYKTAIELLVVIFSIIFGTFLIRYSIKVAVPILFAVVIIFILHMVLFVLAAILSVKSEVRPS